MKSVNEIITYLDNELEDANKNYNYWESRNPSEAMKYRIFCMNEAGQIVAGLLTNSLETAAAYMQRKQANGLITIKTIVK